MLDEVLAQLRDWSIELSEVARESGVVEPRLRALARGAPAGERELYVLFAALLRLNPTAAWILWPECLLPWSP